ncbi:MAG TPA: inositol monophosphatase family protein [Candidatus Methanofastidiosa archaeon]|nr:inositol monophosphatase family protein [Candidatus Methanofastidiosa archaeon]HPR42241.1 inositol monophosphatase family protein [Candidatus Methanofastidiosa archaeon]
MNDRTLCWKLSEEIKTAVESSKRAGNAHVVIDKDPLGGNTYNLDKCAEDAVIDYLVKNGIKCTLISEEAGRVDMGDDFTMILDPVDGSNNAISGLPFYCTSLAILRDGPEYGLVRNLVWEEWFEGIVGYGALVNGKPLEYTPHSNMISVYTRKGRYIDELRQFTKKLRCFGSVALEICYVANGSLLAFVDARSKMRATDIAAGRIVLESSGGIVTDLNGDPLNMEENHVDVVASANKEIHKQILNRLR